MTNLSAVFATIQKALKVHIEIHVAATQLAETFD